MDTAMRTRSGYLVTARVVLVGAVAAGFLLALALATSPQLHQFVHPDSNQPAHSCLATTLQAGAYRAVIVVVVAIQLAAVSVTRVPLRNLGLVESFFLSCRLLEHGPPRVLLS
jgi:ABC-type sulfate transport system permease component